MNRTVVVCFAIAGIVTLELFALSKGHNGALLNTSIAAIAALVGYVGGLFTTPQGGGGPKP